MSQTPPSETRLRLRAVLNAQFTVILAVCLVAAAVGGGLAYTTHVDPGTETELRTVSSLTVESEYVHSAEVTEPNSVFDTGTVLDGRNTYFTRVAPVLDVDVETSYAADAASDIDISFESVLVTQNVGSDDGTVYWDERETLTTETVSGVEPGETATASFALNSSEVDATASEIESDLGASPGETETFVTTAVTVEGTINGESTSYARTIEMTLDHGGDTYTVSEPGLQSDTTEQTEPVTVEQSYGPLRSTGGPVLFLAGLAGASGLAYARREVDLALTPAEREYLSYRDDRSEFAEWITAIRLPESVHNRPEAEASSLRDLVDFAIDNDTGVVEDPGTGAYHAVTDEFVYTYAPPTLAVEGGDGNEETEGETTAGVAGDDEAIDTDETADVSAATDDDGAWVGADVNSAQTSDGRGSEAADSEPSDGAN
ncbi:DUF5305 domain-containing protein [Halorubrum lacusprofundi]|jgi:hypothetical protein|uniref:DUF5305 domain-containing protein n=1 Tax=Halorubrum lacusprofundi (strain ATCC 49239 / DSM 5036 / JCM 8891 / ACAM 34) TaxID=416348 RepID=B9LT18_HALLT|nr:DUF5305 domain-containing protein [Halorubrum lacusprofundi]ACM56083.1 conserved hypothetical protein [Halorubrum lacusprofundi ATCC 49239]MCG1005606.1 DUF5305 domain-containing protein [Halorubrum lacusprofundi]